MQILYRLSHQGIYTCICICAKSLQSCLTVTPWTVTCQAPLSMGFSRQEDWSGWPCPSSDIYIYICVCIYTHIYTYDHFFIQQKLRLQINSTTIKLNWKKTGVLCRRLHIYIHIWNNQNTQMHRVSVSSAHYKRTPQSRQLWQQMYISQFWRLSPRQGASRVRVRWELTS